MRKKKKRWWYARNIPYLKTDDNQIWSKNALFDNHWLNIPVIGWMITTLFCFKFFVFQSMKSDFVSKKIQILFGLDKGIKWIHSLSFLFCFDFWFFFFYLSICYIKCTLLIRDSWSENICLCTPFAVIISYRIFTCLGQRRKKK